MLYKRLKQQHTGIGRQINKYRNEKNKQINTRSTIIFLIRCRKSGFIPNFITNSTKHVYDIFHSKEKISENIYQTLNKHINIFHNKILNLLIKQKHEIRNINTNNCVYLYKSIRNRLTAEEATEFFNSEKTIDNKYKGNTRKRHIKKFQGLQKQQHTKLNITTNDNWFINTTDIVIPTNIKWLLSHGKKFALPYTKEDFPVLKYIADGEECIKTIEEKGVN